MLVIENLKVEVEGKEILHGINLRIAKGETHVIFGKNGSGKSTLLMTIMGFSKYKITSGKIFFKGKDITDLPMFERAKLGMGMAFQRPPSIKGLKTKEMIKLIKKVDEKTEILAKEVDFEKFLNRDLNFGFSGGELKRSELLQLMAQNPDFIMLDEPESGVDVENIKILGRVVWHLLEKNVRIKEGRKKSGLIITHTGYILDYVDADRGHVILDGYLMCSGNPREMFREIQDAGYDKCVSCMAAG
jgi:Fe-S cluster assembly ATP-binding protein